MFDLGDFHYHLTRRNVQLVARTRLHATSPSTPIESISVQDLLTLGLWITRGNGLALRIRADFNAFAPSSTCMPHVLHNVLCDILPRAKLWSQLSLRPSLILPDPTRPRPFEAFEVAFALTHTDLPHSKRPCPAIATDLHHVRPPTAVLRGSIDSIELTLIFAPLVSHDLAVQPSSTPDKLCHTPREGSTPTTFRSSRRRSSVTSIYSFSDHSPVRAEKADGDILFQSPESDLPSADNSVLHHSEEDLDEPDMLLLPKMQPQRTLRVNSPPPSVRPNFQTKEPPIMSQSTLDPPSFMRLIDLSLRHTLGGMIPPGRNLRKPNDNTLEIQLVQAVSDISLADISPALFRPRYIEAIVQRAHLISRIASSISSICSGSRTRHHCSTESATAFSSSSLNLVEPGQLQTQLWHLLQKRKWPTEPLEPLDDGTIGTCNRYEGDRELILDSDEHERPPWEFQHREPDEEIMLDPDMDFTGTMDEDEDLFSSYERTQFSSQDTASLEMMLESDEDEGNMREEDMLLLSERYDDEVRAPAVPAGHNLNFPKTREGVAWSEDIAVGLSDYGREDGDDRASMMLF